MSTLYQDKTHNGVTSLNYFAEQLAGGSNTNSYFNRSLKEILEYYPAESEKLLYANPDDHRASLITLEEARSYCVLNELPEPSKIKMPDSNEPLKQRVIQLEVNLAKLTKQLKLEAEKSNQLALEAKNSQLSEANNNQPEDEPVSAMRTVGALAMLLAKSVKPKYQDNQSKGTIRPALAPIGDAIVSMIEHDLKRQPKYFSSKALQPTIRKGIAAFDEKIQNNDFI